MTLAESSIPGFHQPVRLDRTAHGGGFAIWVKEDLVYEHLSTIDCQGHEIIWLSVQTHPNKLILGALYRPGSMPSHDTALLDYLDAHLDDMAPIFWWQAISTYTTSHGWEAQKQRLLVSTWKK